MKGLSEAYRKVALTAHVADVHRPLAAGSSVGKHNLIVLDENGGVLGTKEPQATIGYSKCLRKKRKRKASKAKVGTFLRRYTKKEAYTFSVNGRRSRGALLRGHLRCKTHWLFHPRSAKAAGARQRRNGSSRQQWQNGRSCAV